MDVTFTSPQTYGWELLAHLAVSSQNGVINDDTHRFACFTIEVLQQHLPSSWGLLAIIQDGAPTLQLHWGVSAEQHAHLNALLTNELLIAPPADVRTHHTENGTPCVVLPLRVASDMLGYLLLEPPPHDNHGSQHAGESPFPQAVAAQLALLLQAHHRQRDAQLAAALQRLNQAVLGGTPLPTLAHLALEELAFLVACEQSALFITSPGHRHQLTLRLLAAHGTPLHDDQREAITAAVLQHIQQQPPLPRASTAPAMLTIEHGTAHWCIVPIFFTEQGSDAQRASGAAHDQAPPPSLRPTFSWDESTAGFVALLGVLALSLNAPSGPPTAAAEDAAPHQIPPTATTTYRAASAIGDQIAQAIAAQHAHELHAEQLRQLQLMHHRASLFNDVLKIGQLQLIDRPLHELFEQVGQSIIALTPFRTILFLMVDQDDAETLLVHTGFGIPQESLDTLTRIAVPLELVQRYLNPPFRIGMGFFIPAESAATLEHDFATITSVLNQAIRTAAETAATHTFSALIGTTTPGRLFHTDPHTPTATEPDAEDHWQPDDKLLVPLYGTGGDLLGLIAVFNPDNHHRPTPRSIEPLEILADHATTALENHYLLSAAHAQTDQMRALYHVGATAASAIDVTTLLMGICQEVFSYLARRHVILVQHNEHAPPAEQPDTPLPHAPTIYVATHDPHDDTLCFDLFMGQDGIIEPFHRAMVPRAGIIGWIIEHGSPVVIRDLQRPVLHLSMDAIDAVNTTEQASGASAAPHPLDVRTTPPHPDLPHNDIRSWLGVPLRIQNRVMGVLVVQDSVPGMFSERDTQFFEALANQLAIAMENIGLFQEREQRIAELNVINSIARIATSTLDIAQMLEQVYTCLVGFLPIAACHIAIYDAEQHAVLLSFVAAGGAAAEPAYTLVTTPYPLQVGSLLEYIIRQRQPLLLEPQHHDIPELTPDSWTTSTVLSQHNTPAHQLADTQGTWMGVPLLANEGNVVGAIGLQSSAAQSYGERELAFISTVASQLALGLHNARLLEQAQGQVRQLGLLNHLASTAAATLELETIYHAVLEAMVQTTGVDQAWMALYDHDEDVAAIVAEIGGAVPSQRDEQGAQSIWSIPLVENPALAWLNEHRQPLVAHDVASNALLAPLHATLHHLDIRSLALVPLILGGEVIGSVELGFVGRQMHFSTHHLTLCQTIANQMTSIIEKARLFAQAQATSQALQAKVGELSTLLEAAGILSSLLQTDELLGSLMDLVVRQLGVTTAALWTLNREGMLVPAAMCGIPDDETRSLAVPVGHGLTGKVVETGQPVIVSDVQERGGTLYPSFNRRYHLVSYMGVPVFYRDQIVGVLSVMSTQQRNFTTDEMMLLVGLAGEAAIALENARLFQDREQRINELMMINRISAEVNANLQLDDLLLVLHQGIGEILDTTYSFIGIYEKADIFEAASLVRLRLVRDGGAVHLSDETLEIDGKGPIDFVILESKPLRMEHGTWYQENGPPLTIAPFSTNKSPFRHEAKFQSGMFVPIMLRGDMLGIIVLRSMAPYAYSTDDVRFLSTIASQAAIAIANANLFNERERRLREMSVLKDIGGAISSTLEIPSVLERLYFELSQAIDVSTSMICLYDERTNVLSYPICYDQGQRLYFEQTALTDDSNGWVIRNRQPLLLHTIEQSRQIGFDDFGLSVFDLRSGQSRLRLSQSKVPQSFLVVPIISSDAVLGVINIQSYQSYAFDDDDLRFVIAVANQVAVTISNLKLFAERGRRIEELEIFNQIGQEMSSTRSTERLEDLPDLIYRQTSRLLDTTNFSMALLDEATDTINFPLFYEQGSLQQMPTSLQQAHDTQNRLRILSIHLARRVIHRREYLLLQGNDMERGGWTIDIHEFKEETNAQRRVQQETEVALSTPPVNRPRSWLGVPMIAGDKVLGVIALQDYHNPYAYGLDDVRLLSTISSWAAIALENARLFDEKSTLAADLERRVAERTIALEKATRRSLEERDRLSTLHTITLELTSMLDLEKIINRALEMVSTSLNVSRGSILLRDHESEEVFCRAVLRDTGIVENVDLPLDFGGRESLVDWVMREHQPLCIDDVREDTRWLVSEGRGEDARSVVAVPLATTDTILGVLILSSPAVGYFSAAQMRLLETIAHEVAIALNNAQLYHYINEMASRMGELMEQHKEEASKSSAILQSLTEGVIVLDDEQHIALLNLAAEHILRISASRVLVRPLTSFADQGETEAERERAMQIYHELESGFQEATTRQGIYTMSFELDNPHQTISVNLAPVTNQDGVRYGDVAVLRDVTAEIEANRAKREFISKVSHELRTPLTAIKGYVDLSLMPEMGTLNEQQQNFLQIVKNNTNRLMDLINDILDISKIESGKIKLKFKLVDLHKIITDVVESLALESEKKQQHVHIDLPCTLPPLTADEKRLTQIIFNLFSNAVKYTYEQGHITIRAFLNPASMMQIEIEDTGVGMSSEQLKKLGQPFYRADSPLTDSTMGTGLGLAISKALVEQHGGELWATSEKDKGATFSFILPLQQSQETSDTDDEEEAE
jgi:GAF domain-containing protein